MRVSCSTDCLPRRTVAEALREIHAAGYAAVDMAAGAAGIAFGPDTAEAQDIQAMLTAHGLVLSSMATAPLSAESAGALPANVDSIRRHLQLARQLGLASLNVHAGDRKQQGFEMLIAGLREVVSYASALGMQICVANRRDSRIEQLEDLRYVLANLQRENVGVAVDCGQFHAAAVNPCHVFREFAGRIGLVRIADRIGKQAVQLGSGEMNVPAIIEAARRCGYDGWLVVGTEPPEDKDVAAFLTSARRFLEQHVADLARPGP